MEQISKVSCPLCGIKINIEINPSHPVKISCGQCQELVFQQGYIPQPEQQQAQEYIQDYQITQKIGEGGMGEVFLAQHRSTEEKVLHQPDLRYKLVFDIARSLDGKAKSVLSTPIFDDVTVTYSNGWQYLEWRW